jgi:protein-tyrosine phosphatase
MYEIIPNLYLSSFRELDVDSSWLVVNCSKDLPMRGVGLRVPVDDAPGENDAMFGCFSDVTQWISDHLNQKVVVHCAAGQQRSAAMVAAFLMSLHPKLPAEQAILYIQGKKKDAFLNHETFRPALEKWTIFLNSRENPNRTQK